MSMIDLSALEKPSLIRPLDPEPEIRAFIADLRERLPQWRGVFESDGFVKVAESWSVRLMLEQARHNRDALSILLAYAAGSDLDHIAATYYAFAGVSRAAGEGDASLRRRIQLAPDAYSSAGSLGGYLYHALSVDPLAIIDADVWFPAPGYGSIALQTVHDETDEKAATDLSRRVHERLSEPKLRTSDILTISPITPLDVHISAILDVPFGPDGALIEAEARKRFDRLKQSVERPRRILTMSAVTSALHAANVTRVRFAAPLADIVPQPGQRVRIATFDIRLERTNG